jgi:hypothetical protein
MASRIHDQLIAVLEAARSEPIGIVIMTNDVTKTRAALYRARAAENNPAFADLQFRSWPYDEGNLVICHGGAVPPLHPNNLGPIDLDGILDLDLDIP